MISEKIDIFLDVGQELNFSTVAKKRYTTQPTISRQIGDLESEWGMQLFVRSNKGLRLTPEGAVMLKCCRKMEQQISSALKEAGEIKASRKDSLRMGFLTDLNAEHYFMEHILNFARQYPELEISMMYGSFGELRKCLKANQLDVIFTYDFEIANLQNDIIVDQVMECEPCFAISPLHPLYEKEKLSIQDFQGETFFLPEEADSPGREKDLLYVLRANQIQDGSICFVPNQESVFLQVRLGRGVALAEAASPQVERYHLRTIPLGGGHNISHISVVAAWERDNLNPFLPALLDQIIP